jgi:hypothetical protein
MTDFRALCAELADSVELLLDTYQRLLSSARPLLITEDRLNRARAALAEQPRGFTPIPVAERLPEPEDCDSSGECWIWDWLAECWRMGPASWLEPGRSGDEYAYHYWLPANALPVPTND